METKQEIVVSILEKEKQDAPAPVSKKRKIDELADLYLAKKQQKLKATQKLMEEELRSLVPKIKSEVDGDYVDERLSQETVEALQHAGFQVHDRSSGTNVEYEVSIQENFIDDFVSYLEEHDEVTNYNGPVSKRLYRIEWE